MNDKKVLFINSIVGTGSTGRIITGLCDVLKEHGVRTLVCYGRGSAPEGYECYRIGSDADVYMHGALSRITDRHGLYSAAATHRLVKKIEEYGPDIIHIHNIHGYYLNYEILFRYLRNCGKKIIWTLHDCWTFTGHCTHFEYAGCERWKSGCHDCMQLREYPKSFFRDASAENYKLKKELFTGIEDMHLVTPSEWLRKEVSQSFMKEYPADVIPTGIDLDRFRPAGYKDVGSDIKHRYGLDGKIIILGVANPWRERKGLQDFIELAGRLSDGYRIVMIGLKPSQMKLLPEKVTGIMKTDSLEEMTAWYSASDVHLNLTLEDTFPTTNIESLACGTPVITYRSGGSPESLDDSCGKTVAKKDIEGVISAIREITPKTAKMRQACMEHAALYDKNDRFREYYEKEYT